MGLGRFRDGKFDLIVVANYLMTPGDWTQWERSLKKASEILYNASEGQMQFGRLYVCDENIGSLTADIKLHSVDGLSSSYYGGLGAPAIAIHLMSSVKRDPLIIVHELGHYVWGLGDEYLSGVEWDMIDETRPIEEGHIIPIVDTGRADNELVALGATAIFTFLLPDDVSMEERTVVANTATTVTVDPELLDYPIIPEILYYFPAECAEDTSANYCIMEACHRERGYFDDAGVWHDLPNPLTEFCTPSNHDPDRDTQQEARYSSSCWEVIVDQPDFSTLTMPDPATGGPLVGWAEPDWIVLDKQPRFALVLDRSRSMASGHKMADAQHGAIYWLEYCAATEDLLTIIWYDHEIQRILDLTEVGTFPDLEAEIRAINDLTPRGSTNIRDALFDALDQIQTPSTRAAVQAALLLTDGRHNTPRGSQASEVIPDSQEAGLRIYTLGVGEPAVVDMDVLDELAGETGGRSFAVGDDHPGEVEAAMIEINAEVRGGIITTVPALFPSVRKSARFGSSSPYGKKQKFHQRPSLQDLLKSPRTKGVEKIIHSPKRLKNRIMAIPVTVEPYCRRVSFSLSYPSGHDLWLYLIGPDGHFLDMTGPGVYHCISAAPHEFAVVEKPQAGRWQMIAVRPQAGPALSFRAVAGGENPHLQVFGGASRINGKQSPVRIWARARWGHDLSNLKVTAAITTPNGRKQQVILTDRTWDEPDSGMFEAYYSPEQPGLYRGLIQINCLGNARIARSGHLISHTTKNRVSLRTAAPRFVRQIPFSFHFGDRPETQDIEHAIGLDVKYQSLRPRPSSLQSAKAWLAAQQGKKPH